MWSEEFDKKIRAAAENDSNSFNEKAWDSMLPLLDQHLPREKKRRWAFLWFFGLLISGTAIFFIVKNNSERTSAISKKQTVIQQQANDQSNQETEINTKDNLNTTPEKQIIPSTSEEKAANDSIIRNDVKFDERILNNPLNSHRTQRDQETKRSNLISKTEKQSEIVTPSIEKKSANKLDKVINPTRQRNTEGLVSNELISQKRQKPLKDKQGNQTKNEDNLNNDYTRQDDNKDLGDKNRSNADNSIVDNQKTSISTAKDSVASRDIATKADIKTSAPTDTASVKTEPIVSKKKPSSSKGSRFTIGISAGPDISSVAENIGKVKMQYGVGVGYAINDRFTVRTGFYVSRKIYTADSADYHPPKSFWTYFDNLQSVDANCLVYEIPLNVVYNFPSSKKDNWFVSGGVSSYLMKKETYVYSYKNSWNQPDSYSRTYKSENNHFFSVLNISGGYRHQVSRSFSLLAEPYLRLPLSGVGFGKVKLNSGGIIFTASFKPFLKRK